MDILVVDCFFNIFANNLDVSGAKWNTESQRDVCIQPFDSIGENGESCTGKQSHTKV